MKTGRAAPCRQWGTGSLRGDPPLAPHRVAIPGTVPFSNRCASLGAVALHRVASNDADPFPQRPGSQDPDLPHDYEAPPVDDGIARQPPLLARAGNASRTALVALPVMAFERCER